MDPVSTGGLNAPEQPQGCFPDKSLAKMNSQKDKHPLRNVQVLALSVWQNATYFLPMAHASQLRDSEGPTSRLRSLRLADTSNILAAYQLHGRPGVIDNVPRWTFATKFGHDMLMTRSMC